MPPKIDSSDLLWSREKSLNSSAGANQVRVVIYPGKPSRGFYGICFLMMTRSTRTNPRQTQCIFMTRTETRVAGAPHPLHWVVTVISWPCSDVRLSTERAGRWHRSSSLFHLQFVHCRVKKGTLVRQGTCVLHLTPGGCNEANHADLPHLNLFFTSFILRWSLWCGHVCAKAQTHAHVCAYSNHNHERGQLFVCGSSIRGRARERWSMQQMQSLPGVCTNQKSYSIPNS